MRLRTGYREGTSISLVAMIDILMIMLVFFMVTSTYLNLDMIPVADRGESAAEPAAAPEGGVSLRRVLRLSADGRVFSRGREIPVSGLATHFAREVAAEPDTEFLLLPSPRADVQALVSVMDSAAAAGVVRLRVVRLEGRE